MPEEPKETKAGTDAGVQAETRDDLRARAIKQIELRRHFRAQLFGGFVAIVVLIAIWATSEYHNAGGWPVHGFSQSSGIHEVWNLWIVYPVGGILLLLSGRAWFVYGNKPISEDEIEREIHRQKGSKAA